jgi:hypothetical protein
MSESAEQTTKSDGGTRSKGLAGGLPARLAIELAIGLSLAAVLLLVAWTSSSAIKFVYGGY